MADPKREVDDVRQQMASLDGDLLRLLDERAKLARRIGALRKDLPQLAPQAMSSLLGDLAQRAGKEMPLESLRQIYREIFAASLALEAPAIVAIVGIFGGGSHAAARSQFGVTSQYLQVDSAVRALEEVSNQRAQYAVVPFETRADGPVQATLAALTATELKVTSCFEVAQNLQLASRSGQGEIEIIHVTPHDLALSQRTLAKEFPNARIATDLTSPIDACRRAVEEPRSAAVAPEAFVAEHALEIVRRNVRDDGDYRVRYAVVGPRPASRTGADTTALILAVRDTPGALHDVLRTFAERDINLTKIQSRPAPGEDWNYLFFLELAGHVTDRPLVAALEELKKLAKFFKVLGSYPAL